MHISRADTATDAVLAVTGEVGPGDVQRLRTGLVDALDDGQRDLLLDARAVTGFDDAAFAAFVIGRSRAKSRQHRLVVLDAADGVVARGLRRTGLIFHFPVYPDSTAAELGLAADRDAVSLRSGGFGELLPIPAQPERSAAAR
jgi:anti-anti-sigma regulatory factor